MSQFTCDRHELTSCMTNAAAGRVNVRDGHFHVNSSFIATDLVTNSVLPWKLKVLKYML